MLPCFFSDNQSEHVQNPLQQKGGASAYGLWCCISCLGWWQSQRTATLLLQDVSQVRGGVAVGRV